MTAADAPQPIDSRETVRAAVAAALDTKADDVKVRQVTEVAGFADWFVIATGYNERQVQAIADRVEERLREIGVRPLHVEGHAAAQWVLLDYGDILVHVFLDERRRYYALERLWSDAPDLTGEFVA